MPIYDFRCSECGHETELLVKSSQDAPPVCPHCQKDALVRQVGAAGFRLAGSGWYETDEKPKGSQRNIAQSETSS